MRRAHATLACLLAYSVLLTAVAVSALGARRRARPAASVSEVGDQLSSWLE